MKKNETQTGAAQLQEAIEAKKDELKAAAAEIKAAAGDAYKTVAAEKKERRARAELDALETAYRAATYTPPEPTDRAELLQGLVKYEADYNARLEKIRASIAETDEKAAQIEREMQQAAMDADANATLELANQREENTAARAHLLEMLERAQALPVYPEGAISDEWEKVCAGLLPQWENLILEVKTLATAYKTAATALLTMKDTVESTRAEMNRRAGGAVCRTIFTTGRDAEGMSVEKNYHALIHSIFSPITGQPI